MTDQDAQLDHLLSLWHQWQQGDKGVRGFNSKALVVGECRGYGLQYESQLEAQDIQAEKFTCRQVNHEVNEMTEPHRTAIFLDARNICNGVSVWNSPRLPDNAEERAVILKFARLILTKRLISAGVM